MIKKLFPLFLVLFLFSSGVGYAQITVTNTFSTGQVIDASQMNTNFTDLGDDALDRTGGTITGNITVDTNITIDGLDLSDWMASNNVYAQDGGATGDPSYSYVGDTDTGMWFPAADTVAITTGGTEGYRMDTSQSSIFKAGTPVILQSAVGTEAGRFVASAPNLDIRPGSSGDVAIQSSAGADLLYVTNAGNVGIGTASIDGFVQIFRGSAGTVDVHATADDFVIEGSTDAGLTIATPDASAGWVVWTSPSRTSDIGARISFGYDSNLMTIGPAGGNLYIKGSDVGVGTSSPISLLDVRSAAGASNGGVLHLGNDELTVVATDLLGRINFSAPLESDGSDAILTGASIWAVAENTFDATNNPTALIFATGASEAAAEKMRLTSGGAVGIGDATPDYILDVERAGNSRFANFEASSTGTGYVYNAVVNTGGTTYYGNEDSVGGAVITSALAYASFFGSNSATATHLVTNGTARLTVDSSGNVGIGTTSPDIKLHVMAADTTNAADASSNLIIEDTGASYLTFLSDAVSEQGILFADAGSTGAGSITYTHSTDAFQFKNNAGNSVGIDASGDLFVQSGDSVFLDGNDNTYFVEATADEIDMVAGGTTSVTVKAAGYSVGDDIQVETGYASVADNGTTTITLATEALVEIWDGTATERYCRFYVRVSAETVSEEYDPLSSCSVTLTTASSHNLAYSASVLTLENKIGGGVTSEYAWRITRTLR